jgi:hypothetical protein
MIRFLQAKMTCVVALGLKRLAHLNGLWTSSSAVLICLLAACFELVFCKIFALHVNVYHVRWSSYYEGTSGPDRARKRKRKEKPTSKILDVAIM